MASYSIVKKNWQVIKIAFVLFLRFFFFLFFSFSFPTPFFFPHPPSSLWPSPLSPLTPSSPLLFSSSPTHPFCPTSLLPCARASRATHIHVLQRFRNWRTSTWSRFLQCGNDSINRSVVASCFTTLHDIRDEGKNASFAARASNLGPTTVWGTNLSAMAAQASNLAPCMSSTITRRPPCLSARTLYFVIDFIYFICFKIILLCICCVIVLIYGKFVVVGWFILLLPFSFTTFCCLFYIKKSQLFIFIHAFYISLYLAFQKNKSLPLHVFLLVLLSFYYF